MREGSGPSRSVFWIVQRLCFGPIITILVLGSTVVGPVATLIGVIAPLIAFIYDGVTFWGLRHTSGRWLPLVLGLAALLWMSITSFILVHDVLNQA